MASKDEETGLRPVASVAGALLVWLICVFVSMRVLRSGVESLPLRVAMVVLGTAGFTVWLVTVARLILNEDEFSQRLHLVAVALTCGATAVLVMAGDFLQTAGLLGPVPLQGVWLTMGVLWWLAIVVATRYYR
jgi:hypothetical protein